MTPEGKSAVLIVEDHENWQDVFTSLLSDEFEVILATDYDKAIRVLGSEEPLIDVVITDISLEVGDVTDEGGMRLLEYVSERHSLMSTIVVTGYPSLKTIKKALKDFSAFDYVDKYSEGGFDTAGFRNTVKNAARRTREKRRKSLVFVMLPLAPRYLTIFDELKHAMDSALGIELIKADDFFLPTSIIRDIIMSIVAAEFIIADLSEKNVNVFYELGRAHALPKTAILLTQTMDDVPPCLKHIRHLVYEDSAVGVKVLTNQLLSSVPEVRSRKKPIDLFGQEVRCLERETDLCLALTPQDEAGRAMFYNIIEPAIKRFDPTMRCKSEGSLFSSDSVIQEIAKNIVRAQVVIADLSGRDPNVFYEMGLSHGFGKKMVLMAKDVKADVPFDLRDRSCIEYRTATFMEQRAAQDKLIEVLREALNEHA